MSEQRAVVTISCPVTWYRQCDWIYANCKNPVDHTNWAAWQIGYDDIYYEIDEYDAIIFTLLWTK